MNQPGEKYVCENCGGTFDKGRSDEDANAEALEQFGVYDASQDDDMAIVCDDCYTMVMSAFDE